MGLFLGAEINPHPPYMNRLTPYEIQAFDRSVDDSVIIIPIHTLIPEICVIKNISWSSFRDCWEIWVQSNHTGKIHQFLRPKNKLIAINPTYELL